MDDKTDQGKNPKISNLRDETNRFVDQNQNTDQSVKQNSPSSIPSTQKSDIQSFPEPPVVASNNTPTQDVENKSQPMTDQTNNKNEKDAKTNQEKVTPSFSNLMSSPQSPPGPSGTVPSMNSPKSPNTVNSDIPDDKADDKIKPGDAPSVAVTIESKKGKRGWGTFIVISVLVILTIYGGLFYLYLENQKLKEKGQEIVDVLTPIEDRVTPTPTFSPDQVMILNGNVIREIPNSDKITLINKNDIESTGITGFASVSVSPDNQKLCVESWSPAPKPFLYTSNVDGSNLNEVSSNKTGCTWSPNSKSIFYTNSTSNVDSTDIYIYYLEADTETNLTRTSVTESAVRRFSMVGFSADETKLICSYEDVGSEEVAGNCEININDQTLNYQD